MSTEQIPGWDVELTQDSQGRPYYRAYRGPWQRGSHTIEGLREQCVTCPTDTTPTVTPEWEGDAPYTVTCADILAWSNEYTGEPFHAALMDAPYEMREIDADEVAAVLASQHQGASAQGFMGREWDGAGAAFRVDVWRAIARHLHPGAFLFVFAGTVNDDLISVAMRQAGLRRHHKILSWSYGSGLQKSTRMDDKIDRRAGAARQVVGTRKHAPKFAAAEFGYREKDNGYNSRERETFEETAPATDMAATWAGHRYGLQHLKPSSEPVLVFQKPYEGDALTSITRTGAGAIWIDGGRIGTDEIKTQGNPAQNLAKAQLAYGLRPRDYYAEREQVSSTHTGRWPANLLLSHHPACTPDACDPACVVAKLGEQSGETQSKASMRGVGLTNSPVYGAGRPDFDTLRGHTDTGTAARFFHNATWVYDQIEAAEGVYYCAKTSPAERDAGLDPLQCRLIDAEEFAAQPSGRRNVHTTIKPLDLTRYLATLLLPPAAYGPRRLLVPFAGVGSEVIGAMLAGWEVVHGIELMPAHAQIAHARIAYWRARRHAFGDGRPITVTASKGTPEGQLTLFDQEAA